MFSHGRCLRCRRECCLLEQFMFQLGQCFFFVFGEKVGSLDGLSHFLGGSEKNIIKKSMFKMCFRTQITQKIY